MRVSDNPLVQYSVGVDYLHLHCHNLLLRSKEDEASQAYWECSKPTSGQMRKPAYTSSQEIAHKSNQDQHVMASNKLALKEVKSGGGGKIKGM